MTDRVTEFRNRVSDSVLAWNSFVVGPYIIAYNNAYKAYQKHIDEQKDADKQRAELFVSIVSIMPGSILMATAASSSLRTLANKAALRVLAQTSLTGALTAYKNIGSNPAAMFAIGKVLDLAKGKIATKIQDMVTQTMQTSIAALEFDPLSRSKQFDSWLGAQELCARDTARAIDEDPHLGAQEKNHLFDALNHAPIAQRPQGLINPATLAPKIELAFYMMALLDSDELVTMSGGRTTSKPIDALPSSPDYPRAKISTTYGGTSQWVGISRPGGKIEDRIDELSKTVFSKPFYAPSGLFGKPDTLKSQELSEAERVLAQLSKLTRPLTPLGLRS